jgi:hypothetical protein
MLLEVTIDTLASVSLTASAQQQQEQQQQP